MKKILPSFVLLCLCFALCIPVWAHGGRTDANGGHWDHSTGTYHYHNGGNTGGNSNNTNNSNNYKPYIPTTPTIDSYEKPIETETIVTSTKDKDNAVKRPLLSTLEVVILIVLIFIYVMPLLAVFFGGTISENIGNGIMTIYFNILMFPFWACCYLFTGITFAIKKIAHFFK